DLAAGYGVGYFHLVWDRSGGLSRNILGGSSTVADALAEVLGDRVRTRAVVTSVAGVGDGVVVRYTRDGADHELRARTAVVAPPTWRASSPASTTTPSPRASSPTWTTCIRTAERSSTRWSCSGGSAASRTRGPAGASCSRR